jgi:hypothetical protein
MTLYPYFTDRDSSNLRLVPKPDASNNFIGKISLKHKKNLLATHKIRKVSGKGKKE